MFGMDELILIFRCRPPNIKHLTHFRFCFENWTGNVDDEDISNAGKFLEYLDNKCISSRVKILVIFINKLQLFHKKH